MLFLFSIFKKIQKIYIENEAYIICAQKYSNYRMYKKSKYIRNN